MPVGGVPAPRFFPMRLPHVLPFSRDPIYFFTSCIADRRPLLARHESFSCLAEIWKNCAAVDGWFVGRFVLMPDHVHFFARPTRDGKTRAESHKRGNRFRRDG
jgi:putative transposase